MIGTYLYHYYYVQSRFIIVLINRVNANSFSYVPDQESEWKQ